MIAAYADLDERVRLLGYAVKYFAKVSCTILLYSPSQVIAL